VTSGHGADGATSPPAQRGRAGMLAEATAEVSTNAKV